MVMQMMSVTGTPMVSGVLHNTTGLRESFVHMYSTIVDVLYKRTVLKFVHMYSTIVDALYRRTVLKFVHAQQYYTREQRWDSCMY